MFRLRRSGSDSLQRFPLILGAEVFVGAWPIAVAVEGERRRALPADEVAERATEMNFPESSDVRV